MWVKRAGCKSERAPQFFKKFILPKKLKKATLRVSALGIFRVKINDYEIDEYFMPGYTNYYKYVPICAYDITGRLKKENLISVIVADGWFAGTLGYTVQKNVFGSNAHLYAEIFLEYVDGDKEWICTNEDWKTSLSEIVSADFFDGQVIDERLKPNVEEYERFENAVFSEEERTFSEYEMEPVVCVKRLSPEILCKNGKLYLDFRQNFAGVINFSAKGKSGDVLVIRYAEALTDDGELYTENLRRAKSEDRLILSDNEAEFSPKFTFHGFRYAEISLENGDISSIAIKNIQGLVLSQGLERTGYFECSDSVINKIYENTFWSQVGNFISLPTDCPQRDERIGWTGDAQIFCDTATYNCDCKKFYENYMNMVRADCMENGSVPSLVPFFMGIDSFTHGSPAWGDAIAIIPYANYLAYGDKEILRKNFQAMKKWADYYLAHIDENFLVCGLNTFGDWLSVKEVTSEDVICQCYFGYTLLILSNVFRILGESGGEVYEYYYKRAKKAFIENYVSKNGKIKSDTQTAYVLSYAVGYRTKDEICRNLLEALRRNDDALTTGFIGTRFLLPVLCEVGETEWAYKIMQNTKYPSWGYCIENGATTIWERWNGYMKEDGFFSPKMNSFNHYSLGSCVYWLYAYVLGIRFEEGDVKKGQVNIKPYFSERLNWVKGKYKTLKGVVEVSWVTKKENEWELRVDVEDGIVPNFDFEDYQQCASHHQENSYVFLLRRKAE